VGSAPTALSALHLEHSQIIATKINSTSFSDRVGGRNTTGNTTPPGNAPNTLTSNHTTARRQRGGNLGLFGRLPPEIRDEIYLGVPDNERPEAGSKCQHRLLSSISQSVSLDLHRLPGACEHTEFDWPNLPTSDGQQHFHFITQWASGIIHGPHNQSHTFDENISRSLVIADSFNEKTSPDWRECIFIAHALGFNLLVYRGRNPSLSDYLRMPECSVHPLLSRGAIGTDESMTANPTLAATPDHTFIERERNVMYLPTIATSIKIPHATDEPHVSCGATEFDITSRKSTFTGFDIQVEAQQRMTLKLDLKNINLFGFLDDGQGNTGHRREPETFTTLVESGNHEQLFLDLQQHIFDPPIDTGYGICKVLFELPDTCRNGFVAPDISTMQYRWLDMWQSLVEKVSHLTTSPPGLNLNAILTIEELSQ
jgi:hypothetical protein